MTLRYRTMDSVENQVKIGVGETVLELKKEIAKVSVVMWLRIYYFT